jgi:hypothetical protein
MSWLTFKLLKTKTLLVIVFYVVKMKREFSLLHCICNWKIGLLLLVYVNYSYDLHCTVCFIITCITSHFLYLINVISSSTSLSSFESSYSVICYILNGYEICVNCKYAWCEPGTTQIMLNVGINMFAPTCLKKKCLFRLTMNRLFDHKLIVDIKWENRICSDGVN